MSEQDQGGNQVKFFYTTEKIKDFKLIINQNIKKVKPLTQDSDYYYFTIEYADKSSSLMKIKRDSENQPDNHNDMDDFSISYAFSEQIVTQGKIIDYEPQRKTLFILQNQADLISYNFDNKEMLRFNANAHYAVYLPLMKATLLMSKEKSINVYIHESKQLLPPSTLTRILQPYSHIKLCDSYINEDNNVYIVTACYSTQKRSYSILLITLIETPQNQVTQNNPRFQFKVLDTLQFKQGDIINRLQLIACSSQLILLINNYKIRKVTLNYEGIAKEQYRRMELRAKHDHNLIDVKLMVLLQNQKDLLIKDGKENIKIIRLQKDKTKANDINLYFNKEASKQNEWVINFQDNLFSIRIDQNDKQKIQLRALTKIKSEKLINYLIEEQHQIQLAQTLIRSIGGNSSFIKLYQLEKTGYKDIKLIKEFLNQEFKDANLLLDILTTKNIKTIQAFNMILHKVIEVQFKIDIQNPILKQLLLAHNRLKLLQKLAIEIPDTFSLRNYCFEDKIEQLISVIPKYTNDFQDSFKIVFKQLDNEIILNYENVMKNLPLQDLEPRFLLEIFPPGHSQNELNSFWQKFQQLRPNAKYILYDNSLYQQISVSYIYQHKQPGKALRILQEAAQNRQIQGLTKLAMQAIETLIISDPEHLQDYEKKIGDIFGFQLLLQDSLKKIEGYFSQAKWIFMMDQKLYKQYQNDFKYYLIEIIGIDKSSILQEIIDYHCDISFLFLRQEDLAQFLFDIIYEHFGTDQYQQAEICFNKLEYLILANNQEQFLRQFLLKHNQIQQKLHKDTDYKITYKELLRLQLNSSNDNYIDRVNQICEELIQSVISKSKKVKEQVLQFGRQKTLGQIDQKWINLLQNLILFRDNLGYKQSQVDVYQLFLQRLLDNRVTSSIEQLIKGQQIPIEDIQISVLRYLQNQYNKCADEQLYQHLSNAESFVNMLIDYDSSGKYLEELTQEFKLLDITHFLKSHNLLIGQLPMTQIRQDFQQDRIIDRVLQIHGFEEYPRDYSLLAELQHQINSQKNELVVVKILKHFDKLRYFESQDNMPDFINQFIYETILLRTQRDQSNDNRWIDSIDDILVKILSVQEGIDKWQFKKDLISFLQNNMNKLSSNYYQVCQIFIRTMKDQRSNDLYQSLKQALEQEMTNKVKHLFRKIKTHQQNQDTTNDDIFISIIERTQMKYSQIKQLSQIIDISDDLKIRIKQLKRLQISQIIQGLKDPDFIIPKHIQIQDKQDLNRIQNISSNNQEQQLLNEEGQLQKSEIVPQIEDNPLLDLINNKDDEIQSQLIIEMNYQTWDDKFDYFAFINDFKRSELQQIPIEIQNIIIDKTLSQSLDINISKQQLLNLFIEFDTIICLYLLKDISEMGGLSDDDHISTHINKYQFVYEIDNKQQKQGGMLQYLTKQLITDHNVIYYMQKVEIMQELSDRYQKLFACALYLNKLDKFIDNYWCLKTLAHNNIIEMFYTLIDKDTLIELIDNNNAIKEINKKFIQKFNEIIRDTNDHNDDLLNAIQLEI